MKTILSLVIFAITAISSINAQTVSAVVGATAFNDSLWIFDATNFQISHSVAPSMTGNTVTGITGLAKHPTSGSIYAIVKTTSSTNRFLGKINIVTGVITQIGNLGDKFASITFKGDTLFGVTGDGGAVPETLFRIDTSSAVTTLYRALGNGADGEIINYNPNDGMIYHWSGGGTLIYEKFLANSPTSPIINIPVVLMGGSPGETFGALHMSNNTFLTSNISSTFNNYSTTGIVTASFGTAPNDIRGMVEIQCTRNISGNPSFCAGSSTQLTASPASTYQWLLNGTAISGATNQSYSANAAGTYTCIVQDLCGTDTITTPIAVTQGSIPVVNLSGSASFCTGDSTLLTGSSGGTSQWYFNGAAIPGATTNTYYASQAGNYNMTKTNTSGCSDSAAVGIMVTINALPAVTFTFPVPTICAYNSPININGLPAGGIFSGTGVVGSTFDPSTASNGSNVVTYTYVDANNCTNYAIDQIVVDACAGIPILSEMELIVSPNPAKENIHLISDKIIFGEVLLYDFCGKIVERKMLNNTYSTEINTTLLTNGIYFLKFRSEEKTKEFKVLIQH